MVGWWHAEQVCAGLEEAVQTMKLNEVAEVIVQPRYGFGVEEHQVPEATIPANSTLFYTVELAELNKVPYATYSLCSAQGVSGLAVTLHLGQLYCCVFVLLGGCPKGCLCHSVALLSILLASTACVLN